MSLLGTIVKKFRANALTSSLVHKIMPFSGFNQFLQDEKGTAILLSHRSGRQPAWNSVNVLGLIDPLVITEKVLGSYSNIRAEIAAY